MEAYTYKGISEGKYVEGEIEALNQDEASFKLKEQKIIITNLIKSAKKKGAKKEKSKSKGSSLFGKKKVKVEDILGAAKASVGPIASSNTISLSADLEADLDAESSKGLNELKESAPKLEPEAVQRASYRARRAKSDNAVGITFAQIGNNAMAVDYFKKAIEKDPDNGEYKINLAVALYRIRNYEKAFEIFEEVKLKSPELVGQVSFIESMGEKPSKYKKFD